MSTPNSGRSRRVVEPAIRIPQTFAAPGEPAGRHRRVVSPAIVLPATAEPCAILNVTVKGQHESGWANLPQMIQHLVAEINLEDVKLGGQGYAIDYDSIQLTDQHVTLRLVAKLNVNSQQRAADLQPILHARMADARKHAVENEQQAVRDQVAALKQNLKRDPLATTAVEVAHVESA